MPWSAVNTVLRTAVKGNLDFKIYDDSLAAAMLWAVQITVRWDWVGFS